MMLQILYFLLKKLRLLQLALEGSQLFVDLLVLAKQLLILLFQLIQPHLSLSHLISLVQLLLLFQLIQPHHLLSHIHELSLAYTQLLFDCRIYLLQLANSNFISIVLELSLQPLVFLSERSDEGLEELLLFRHLQAVDPKLIFLSDLQVCVGNHLLIFILLEALLVPHLLQLVKGLLEPDAFDQQFTLCLVQLQLQLFANILKRLQLDYPCLQRPYLIRHLDILLFDQWLELDRLVAIIRLFFADDNRFKQRLLDLLLCLHVLAYKVRIFQDFEQSLVEGLLVDRVFGGLLIGQEAELKEESHVLGGKLFECFGLFQLNEHEKDFVQQHFKLFGLLVSNYLELKLLSACLLPYLVLQQLVSLHSVNKDFLNLDRQTADCVEVVVLVPADYVVRT